MSDKAADVIKVARDAAIYGVAHKLTDNALRGEMLAERIRLLLEADSLEEISKLAQLD